MISVRSHDARWWRASWVVAVAAAVTAVVAVGEAVVVAVAAGTLVGLIVAELTGMVGQ